MHLYYTLSKKKNSSLVCFSDFQITIICRTDSPAGVSGPKVMKIYRVIGLPIK